MDRHFDTVNRVQLAVIAGDLGAAREAASTFAGGLRDSDHQPGWHDYLQDVRAGAWTTARAQDLATAARGTARAAGACGQCHAAHGVVAMNVDRELPVAPRTGELDDFMHRHGWALDRLWIGLIAPSDAAWQEGVRALGEAGMFPLSPDLRSDPTMVALADRLAVTSTRAISAMSSTDRAVVYGELIGECASCHRRLSDVLE